MMKKLILASAAQFPQHAICRNALFVTRAKLFKANRLPTHVPQFGRAHDAATTTYTPGTSIYVPTANVGVTVVMFTEADKPTNALDAETVLKEMTS